MNVKKEDLLHVAKLAKLTIAEEELPEYMQNLENILNFTKVLNKIDTSDVELGSNEKAICNIMREDVAKRKITKDELLANAPSQENGMFSIPQILN